MRGALSVSDWYLQDGWQSFEQMAGFAQKRIWKTQTVKDLAGI